MKGSDFLRLNWLPILAVCFSALALPPSVTTASPPPADSVHFCAFDYEQWRRDHPRSAAKRPADLNVGQSATR